MDRSGAAKKKESCNSMITSETVALIDEAYAKAQAIMTSAEK
jgi:hypothetical protein